MKIFDWLAQYCEARNFRLTIQDNKYHLVWVANNNIRRTSFEDAVSLKQFVDIRK